MAERIGYPVLIKAAGGGGGRGMRVARDAAMLAESLPQAQAEAKAYFGNGAVYLERYLDRPRHIEIQILGRWQRRRHPSRRARLLAAAQAPEGARGDALARRSTPSERAQLAAIADERDARLGYRSAGTLEFLYQDGEFFFIEMNTRLQVEHPISEDDQRHRHRARADPHRRRLPLGYRQEDIELSGPRHRMPHQCRASARPSAPSPGTITSYHAPGGLGVRVDSALYQGYIVPPNYDSLIAKLDRPWPRRATNA